MGGIVTSQPSLIEIGLSEKIPTALYIELVTSDGNFCDAYQSGLISIVELKYVFFKEVISLRMNL